MAARVETESGRIEGRSDGGLYHFLGVPFAAPPVGPLRWRPPVAAEPWSGTRPTTAFGPAALQAPRPNLPLGTDQLDEDCLYLNVWTPTLEAEARRPIMVWLHGGGYISGAASEPVYDGAGLAAHGAVVVTANYRLHVFGYLAHPETGANFGLRDQLAAIAWIKRHAAAFGGDPDNITIFGESAGAGSVHRLQTAPAADGLFHKAIQQSGGFAEAAGVGRPFDLAQAHIVSARVFEALGGGGPERLRTLPAAEVLHCADELYRVDLAGGQIVLPHQLVWAPVEDDDVLPFGSASRRRGARPLLMGWNANEGRYFFRPGRAFMRDQLEHVALELCGAGAVGVLACLDSGTPEAVYESLDRLFSTAMGSEAAFAAAAQAAALGSAVQLYRFDRVSPGAARQGVLANHTAELPYVFGTLDEAGGYHDAADRALSAAMQKAWTDFAKGEAMTVAGQAWPRFRDEAPALAVFGESAGVGPFARDALFRAVRNGRG